MTQLSVNLNKVALLRNSRTLDLPNVLRAATICIEAGANGITVHPRPDGRHIRPEDVHALAGLLISPAPTEFNIEGNPFAPGFLDLVKSARPTQCTLVPDEPEAFTSDHGWNVAENADRLRPVLEELHHADIRTSLFMDPDTEQIQRAGDLEVDRIELYTEPYARAFAAKDYQRLLETYAEAARKAQEAGLGLNAGHDLNLDNLGPFLRAVPGILEVSIGHALIADALEMGLAKSVKTYLDVIASAQ